MRLNAYDLCGETWDKLSGSGSKKMTAIIFERGLETNDGLERTTIPQKQDDHGTSKVVYYRLWT